MQFDEFGSFHFPVGVLLNTEAFNFDELQCIYIL